MKFKTLNHIELRPYRSRNMETAHNLFALLFKLNPSRRGFSQNSFLPGNFQ